MRRQINSEELQVFFILIGESIWFLLNVEEALNNYIVLKKDVKVPGAVPFDQAEALLTKQRKNTFGKSLKIAREAQILSEELQQRLDSFKDERNWLVHHLMHKHHEDLYLDETRSALMNRLSAFSDEAQILHRLVETEMENFVVAHGIDRKKITKDAGEYIKRLKGEKF